MWLTWGSGEGPAWGPEVERTKDCRHQAAEWGGQSDSSWAEETQTAKIDPFFHPSPRSSTQVQQTENTEPNHPQPRLLIGQGFNTRRDKPRRPETNAYAHHIKRRVGISLQKKQTTVLTLNLKTVAQKFSERQRDKQTEQTALWFSLRELTSCRREDREVQA